MAATDRVILVQERFVDLYLRFVNGCGEAPLAQDEVHGDVVVESGLGNTLHLVCTVLDP